MHSHSGCASGKTTGVVVPDSEPNIEIYEEAARWFRARQTAQMDVAAFEVWLDADPRHIEALINVEAASNLFAAGASEDLLSPQPMAEAEVKREAFARRAVKGRSGMSPSRRQVLGGMAAAASAAAIGAGWWLNWHESVSFVTGAGEQRTERMSDGSTLTVDANTELMIKYTHGARTLNLRHGRAFFQVAHDGRPFTVASGGVAVLATGTAFEVEARGADVAVALSEGRVKVSKFGARIADMQPGQRLILKAGRAPALTLVKDMGRDLSWRTGTLYFENAPLSEVIERLNDYSRKRVVIADKVLADLRVTTGFKVDGTEAFLSALRTYYSLRVTEQDNQIVLHYPRGRAL
jgi:transmembrane sensor